MKKITLTIIILGFALFAYAATVGDIFTSEQFINANPWNQDICEFVDAGVYDGNVVFYFDCFTIKRQSANQYEVMENNQRVTIPKQDVTDCISLHGSLGQCWNQEIKNIVVTDIRDKVYQIREDINRTQSKASLMFFNSSQLIITNSEIND